MEQHYYGPYVLSEPRGKTLTVPKYIAHICKNCKYWEPFSGACCNGSSDQRGDFTDAEFGCECWEVRHEDRQKSRRR
jgi:hypothetical protein